MEHWKTDVSSQGERIFLLTLVLTYSVTWGEFPSPLQVRCFPGVTAVLVPPWPFRARGRLQGRAGEDGRFLCAPQALCVPHPRRPLHLWGAEKQSKKFISRKQTQMYQPSSCITSVARNEVPEGKKCKENKPRSSLSPSPTSAPGCCWLGSQEISKNSWRVLIPLSQLSLMGMEQPLAQEVLNSPALWMSL